MGFSSVPRLSGWSFQQRICVGVLPPPHCPDISGPAASPTDTLRKDSALTPVTSEKSTLFSWVTKIARLFKDLSKSSFAKDSIYVGVKSLVDLLLSAQVIGFTVQGLKRLFSHRLRSRHPSTILLRRIIKGSGIRLALALHLAGVLGNGVTV